MQQPQSDIVKAVETAIMDRQTLFVESLHGTACILPMEDYIRLTEMKNTLHNVICRAQEGNILGLLQVVEAFSTWLLEGGGETYTLGGGGGQEDARTL